MVCAQVLAAELILLSVVIVVTVLEVNHLCAVPAVLGAIRIERIMHALGLIDVVSTDVLHLIALHVAMWDNQRQFLEFASKSLVDSGIAEIKLGLHLSEFFFGIRLIEDVELLIPKPC